MYRWFSGGHDDCRRNLLMVHEASNNCSVFLLGALLFFQLSYVFYVTCPW